ncbi:MAG: nucleic acid-binding protein, partial [Treponema sp.]|nr:nucleic acid-binding protein [Treponema sp.]
MISENDLDKLRTLQDILSEKIILEHEIQEIPKQLGALEEAHSRTRKAYIEKNLEYEKVKSAEEEFRTLMRDAEAAREKAERAISESGTTQREFEALNKERQYAEEKEQ